MAVCTKQSLSERKRSGSDLERSRINVGDRVLVIEGTYAGHKGAVLGFDPKELVATLGLDKWPGTRIKISVESLKGKGWKEIKYPTSRANDPIDW